jgi:hypothetical protein
VLQCGHQCKFSSLSTTHSTWTKACSHLLVTTWRASTRATQTVSSRWEQTFVQVLYLLLCAFDN